MAGLYVYDKAGTIHWFPIDHDFYHAVIERKNGGGDRGDRGVIRPISDPPLGSETISPVGRCPHCGELVKYPTPHLANECRVVKIPRHELHQYPPERKEA